mmetsp:Transcript_87162/g.222043  ORF Transcript_87162/g.222043 Transcript_87162/m.222043 type:complete len:606 (+) Transcript_87162:36-1853(+)
MASKPKKSADRWLAEHLRPESYRLAIGAGALVLASFVNFRTGPELKAAIEVAGSGAGRQQASRSLLLFATGAVASCLRTIIFDSTTERLRASLAAEVFAARLRTEPASSSADDDDGSADSEDADNKASKVAHGSASTDDSDVVMCAELVPKLQNVARYTSSVVGGTFAMFRSSWKLSAVIWPLLVTGAMRGVRAGAKKAGTSAQKLAEAREEALGFAEERLQHRDLVRWFVRAEPEADEYRERCNACVTLASKAARGRGIAHMIVDLSSKGVLLGLCQLGSWLVQQGELTAGELTSFFFHATFLGLGLYGLVGLAPEIAVGRAAAKRLSDVVARANSSMPLSEVPVPSSALAIRFEDVHFEHTSMGKKVLRGFTLDVKAGSTCALVGTSGSGKSTALALLLRDFDPQRGRILIDGQDIQAMELDHLRAKLGIAPQHAALLGQSVHDAIAFGLGKSASTASSADVEQAARTACAHGFVVTRQGAYASPVGRAGALLSGGERQRLSLARVLARRAPILLLDEPTSALDAATAAELSEAVLAPRPGRPTTLVVTHSLALIKKCERVAVISAEGQIVQCGEFSALAADATGPLAQIIKAGELVDDATPS